MTDALLPCPFCGEQPELQDHCSAWGVHCVCKASIIGKRVNQDREHGEKYYRYIRQTAIDAWNRRVTS